VTAIIAKPGGTSRTVDLLNPMLFRLKAARGLARRHLAMAVYQAHGLLAGTLVLGVDPRAALVTVCSGGGGFAAVKNRRH
jgi:hypothetical protein